MTADDNTPNTTKPARCSPFYEKSDEYNEFCALCDRMELLHKDFPKIGSNAEIDRWIEQKNFSRNGVKKKFKQWKASKEAQALDKGERFVQDDEIPSSDNLIRAVKAKDVVQNYFNDDAKLAIFDDACFITLVLQLREKSIEKVNEALSDTSKVSAAARARIYHVMKKENCRLFSASFVNLEVDCLGSRSMHVAYARILAHSLLQVIHLGFRHRNCPTLEAVMDKAFSELELDNPHCAMPSDKARASTLYYVSGWEACAAEKKAKISSDTSPIKKWITAFLCHSVTSKQKAKDSLLPISKVVRIKKFGKMKYPSKAFYHFVAALNAFVASCCLGS